MTRLRVLLLGLVLFVPLSGSRALARNFEGYCNLQGFAAPVRQTILILDEHHVFPETGSAADRRNFPWRKFIGSLLLADEATLEQNFLPRERVTLLLARKDGAGTRTIFSGCMPFFSPAEKSKVRRASGFLQSVNAFFGTGRIAGAKRSMSLFQSRLGDAVHEALQPSMLSAKNAGRERGGLARSGFITSLKQGSVVNLAYGLPRIIIFSDMSRFLRNIPADRTKARKMGFDLARAANLNFRNAEIYVVGMSGNPAAHDALRAFFLASHGELVSTGPANMLPDFLSAPVRVARYQGRIQYPDNKFPIRIRLATDRNGTAVESWISVRTSTEQFAPIHGVVTCNARGSCTYTGDDVFAQAWNPARAQGAEPVFDPSLPFAGARTLRFHFDGNWMKGSISDTLIRFQGVKNYRLEFTARRSKTSLF